MLTQRSAKFIYCLDILYACILFIIHALSCIICSGRLILSNAVVAMQKCCNAVRTVFRVMEILQLNNERFNCWEEERQRPCFSMTSEVVCSGILWEASAARPEYGNSIDVERSVRKGGFRNAIFTERAILLAVSGYGELRQMDANRQFEGSDTNSGRFITFLQEVCVPFFRIQIYLSVTTVIPCGLTVGHEVVDHYWCNLHCGDL